MTDPDGCSPEMHDAEARLREELHLAPYRAQLTMLRLAAGVRTERVTVRDHLEDVLDALHDLDEKIADDTLRGRLSSRGRLVLRNDLQIYLSGKRGMKRPYDLRHREALKRLEVAESALSTDDPELWRLRIREAEARAALPDQRKDGIADIRHLLEKKDYPKKWNFLLSLHAMNLAVRLRSDDDDAVAASALEILEREIGQRTERYTAKHPFTLVARANRILHQLHRLEMSHDRRALTATEVTQARALIEDAGALHADRVEALGERSGPAIRSLAHQARALRLAGEHEESRAVAATAYALRGDDPETARDDEVPAILQILMAGALSKRRQTAMANAALLCRQPAAPTVSPQQLRAAVDNEIARAQQMREEILARLASAEDVLGHQVPYRRWMARASKIRDELETGPAQ